MPPELFAQYNAIQGTFWLTVLILGVLICAFDHEANQPPPRS